MYRWTALVCLAGCLGTPAFTGREDGGGGGSDAHDGPLPDVPMFSACVPTDGLVAYYRFDDQTGSVATDETGRNNGDVAMPSWTTGKFAGGLQFDQTDRYVLLPSNSLTNNLPAITTCAWVRVDHVLNSLSGIIVDKSVGDGYTGWNMYLNRGGKNGDEAFVGFYTPFNAYKYGNTALSLGVWHHACTTWSGVAGTDSIRLYLDGAPDLTQVADNLNPPKERVDDTTFRLTLGHASTTPPYPFPGAVDEVAIYQRVLAGEEITALFNCMP